MSIRLFGLLPYVRVELHHQGIGLSLDQVLIDTGSERSVFSSDKTALIGITPEPSDRVSRMAGIGGSEWVCWKRLDRIDLGDVSISDFDVQIGSMNYGFPIQGIIGMDFLLRVQAIIDLDRLEINPPQN
ncbi:MAG TPA: retropepsin-like aspartic protease [Thermoanaerobaculia bacterium]|nr:retropepsin-like aspartic protease [Thermoanaerobaculia bacterium]